MNRLSILTRKGFRELWDHQRRPISIVTTQRWAVRRLHSRHLHRRLEEHLQGETCTAASWGVYCTGTCSS